LNILEKIIKLKEVIELKITLKSVLFGLGLILFTISLSIFSFASEEKDLINNALKYLDENRYNEAVVELEEALALVRNKANLELVNLFLCEEYPQMFGIYNPKENTSYNSSDTIFIYAEPRNLTYQEVQTGLYQLHFKAEIYLLDSENNVLLGEMNFLDFPLTSRVKNSEIFISSDIPLSMLSLTPGSYKFRLVIKDVLSQKSTEAIVGFTYTE